MTYCTVNIPVVCRPLWHHVHPRSHHTQSPTLHWSILPPFPPALLHVHDQPTWFPHLDSVLKDTISYTECSILFSFSTLTAAVSNSSLYTMCYQRCEHLTLLACNDTYNYIAHQHPHGGYNQQCDYHTGNPTAPTLIQCSTRYPDIWDHFQHQILLD